MEATMSGREFRELRKRLRLQQEKLAFILGCTRQHVGRLEERDVVPPVYALALKQLEAAIANAAA